MTNQTFNTASIAAGVSQKTIIPTYWIEDAICDGNNVEVDFTINDEWESTAINYNELRTFVEASGLTNYCFDYSVNGTHVQDAGTFNVDTFLAENLNDAVRAYLEAKGFQPAAERMAA